ncbi:MAG: hypothetical protein ACJ78Q_18435 [Chloroflexia bacterium]
MAYDPPSQPPGEPPEERGEAPPEEMPSGSASAPPPASDYPPQSATGPYGTMMPPSEYPASPPPGSMQPPPGGYTPPPSGGNSAPPGPGGYGPPQGSGPPPGGSAAPPGGYTPPPPYATPGMAGATAGGQTGVQGLIQSYINAITRPSPNTYAAELGNASWARVWIGIGVVALIGLLGAVVSLGRNTSANLDQMVQQLRAQGFDEQRIQEIKQNVQNVIDLARGGGPVGSVFGTVIFFFLGAGIMYLAARVLGGSGSGFMTHAYLLSLTYTPIKVVLGLVDLLTGGMGASVASAGLGCISLLLFVVLYGYLLYSQGLSMQVSQRLPAGRAQLAAFTPALTFLLLICFACLGLVLLIAGIASRAQQ